MAAHNPSTKNWVVFYTLMVMTAFTTYLAGGFLFSVGLLFILGSHEFGHYWASRKNGVKTSLPYFVPAPPIFIAGTFGAFIQIKEPIPDRRVLMEIGAAGPITGFIVALPILIAGLALSVVGPAETAQGLTFGNSLLLNFLSHLVLGVSPSSPDVNIHLHPLAFAGWIGMFVTALNLLPIGQLDGGHIMYALFRFHYHILARIFFILLFPLGYLWPGWLFWALLITLVGFRPAPLTHDVVPLERKHKILGAVSIAIFILTFIPVPFKAL